MVRILTVVAVMVGDAFFAYGLAIGRPLWVNVVFMLGIIVANVPEGLLPTLTLALAMGGLRLAKKKVLVKSLNAVEALGSVEVICTDKTGTLTKNELAVTGVVDAPSGEPLGDRACRAPCSRSPWPRRRSTDRPARSRAIRSTSPPPPAEEDGRRSARVVARHRAPHRLRRAAPARSGCAEARRIVAFRDQGRLGGRAPTRRRIERRTGPAATRRCAASRRKGCASSRSRPVASAPKKWRRRNLRSKKALICTAFCASRIRSETRCPMRSNAATWRAFA